MCSDEIIPFLTFPNFSRFVLQTLFDSLQIPFCNKIKTKAEEIHITSELLNQHQQNRVDWISPGLKNNRIKDFLLCEHNHVSLLNVLFLSHHRGSESEVFHWNFWIFIGNVEKIQWKWKCSRGKWKLKPKQKRDGNSIVPSVLLEKSPFSVKESVWKLFPI